ncbi:MAG TPA: efflux transporter outer membrane subunit [Steroidobacteraceae bacterium]|nr:efflux transporter outer membrane subunit [Steroidobacteraceae bacterium]
MLEKGGSLIRVVALAVSAAVLAGCAVGPNYKKPDTPVTRQFAGAEVNTYSTAEQAQTQFWTQFGDDTLNQLVSDALTANHDLRIALGHLVEARAARRESLFDLAPTVTAKADHTNQLVPQVEAGFPLSVSYYDAGFDATWELDLFGRVRRGVEARKAQLQGAEATLRDAQVSVIAEVARTYFELRGEQTQLAVAQQNVVNQTDTLKLTQARLDAGRGTELDTSRAQSQLSSTLSTIAPLQASVARSIHRLGVLTGRDPNALTGLLSTPHDLPDLPRIVAVGDPATLLRRRPDIRVAERQLAASTALVGVAIGDLFPKVTFNGNFTYAASSPGNLGTAPSRSYVIGPGISWAAFDLGRVQAQVAQARARDDVALATYEQTVLRALEETENALVTHARARDSLAHVADAAEASATAARLARTRYEGGYVDFLEVLDAERTQLEAEDRLAQSRTDTATSLIAVYKALGGGWELAPLPRYTRAADRMQ